MIITATRTVPTATPTPIPTANVMQQIHTIMSYVGKKWKISKVDIQFSNIDKPLFSFNIPI